jgi:crossover junction endodeoxyribonuclease RuvC
MPTGLLGHKSLRVLGIDPGFDRTGFGVIEQLGSEVKWIAHGCIQTSAKDEYVVRLQAMRDELKAVVERFKPDCVAMEDLFFQTNAKTAIKVGMARGVALITLADSGLDVIDITPSQVKQGIAGWGKADKKQVQEMVMRFLKLKECPKPDDAADALAIAIVGGTMFRQPR